MKASEVKRIEMKRIRYCEWMSDDSNAYSADIYVNGKIAFYARNEGNGGMDLYCPVEGTGHAAFMACVEYANSLLAPEEQIEDVPVMGLEILLGDLLERYLAGKQLQRASHKGRTILFTVPGDSPEAFRTITIKETQDPEAVHIYIRKRYPGATIIDPKSDEYKAVHIRKAEGV